MVKGGINGTGGIGPVADRDWTGCLSTEKRGVPPGKFWNLFMGPSDFCGGGDVCFCYFMPGKAMKNMQKKLKLEDCASVIFCREMIHLRGEPEKCGRTAFLFLHPSYFFLLQKRGCTGKILFLANFFSLSGTSLFSP